MGIPVSLVGCVQGFACLLYINVAEPTKAIAFQRKSVEFR